MDYPQSEPTLKMQFLRMQLETLAYARIQLGESDTESIARLSDYWRMQCEQVGITPYNDFVSSYAEFETETVLKFAPPETLRNMISKAWLTIEKNGFQRKDIEALL